MLVPVFFAALAAISTVAAQDVTSSATRCTTRFGYYALPTGTAGSEAVPTWYRYTTTTNFFSITYTTRDTVTATPSATTFTDVLTTTTTFSTTTTSTPSAITVPTPAGFIPLLAVDVAQATPNSRIKRYELGARDSLALGLHKRQTAANHTGGFSVDRDGHSSSLDRKFVQRVDCRVSVTVNSTTTTIVTGLPETVFVAAQTATAVTTTTVSTTTTVTEILPTTTIYEACRGNNIVYQITDFDGNTLVFDRVIYRPAQGFPIENEYVVNTTNAINCCIACQTTAFCAGSFFVPSDQECHLRLTQPPAAAAAPMPALPAPSSYASGTPFSMMGYNSSHYNATYPTAYPTASAGIFPTGALSMVPSPSASAIAAPGNGTCAMGSMSLYLGTIQGQSDFPEEYALRFSNGPCGRLSVWPIPVTGMDDSLEVRRAKML
ncbi:Nn.00g066860.m01.CDS01 [Neocucurbitaria sp. VM-36]